MTTAIDIRKYLENTVCEAFKAEIAAYIELSNDPNAENIITYNETAILSIFKSAIIRNQPLDKVWSMQEFAVFDDKNAFKGRGDLFVMFRKDEINCDILFEAKRLGKYIPTQESKAKEKSWEKEALTTIEQGLKYMNTEKKHFIKPSFLVTIFFEIILSKDIEKYRLLNPTDIGEESEYFAFYINAKKTHLCVHGYVTKFE